MIYMPVAIRRLEGRDPVYQASFLVDTGAMDSMAPAVELERIGVEVIGHRTYALADGRHQTYPFGFVRIELMGEVTPGRIVFGPDAVEPVLGVTVLESMGLVVDPVSGTLRRLPAIPLKSAARSRRRLHADGQRVEAASGIRSTFAVSCTAGE